MTDEDEAGRETPWIALIVDLPRAIEDDAAAELGEGSLGVRVTDRSWERVTLEVFFSSGTDATGLVARARTFLSRRGLSAEERVRTAAVEDGLWVERYRASLSPIPLGARFVVEPGRRRSAPGEREAIRIEPGRAFGTGEHPTTRLCAEAIEHLVRDGTRWLDLGTGSGVLAIVAARLGAARVDAVDVDPEAVEVARESAAVNGVEDRVRVSVGSVDGLAADRFDGCVANIATAFFLSQSREIARVLRPRGVLVASGVPVVEAEAVAAALEDAGFATVETRSSGEWALLLARRMDR